MKKYFGVAFLIVACAMAVEAQSPRARTDKEKPKAKPTAEEAPPSDVSAFMRLKLDNAREVLEGLATEDFKQIAQHSQQMALLVQDETWMVLQTPEYRHESTEFQMVANRLTEAAREENLDGVTLAYIDLTVSCVNCHKYTRASRKEKTD